jgi:alpha-1,3-rhamnosyltransferase
MTMFPDAPGGGSSAEHPLVSVVTPCYNHQPFLADYFAGLRAQTYEHVELIIFDDGSTDGSWQEIRARAPELERKFKRVIIERHENMGLLRELELALQRVTGELLCILESDDYFLPTKLEENVRFLREHGDVGVVHSDVDYVHDRWIERDHWLSSRRRIPEGDVFSELLASNFVLTCAFCCRTALVRDHVDVADYIRSDYPAADYPMFLDLARRTPFGYIDRSLARYRVRAGSLSHPTDPYVHFEYFKRHLRMRLDYTGDTRVSPELAHTVESDYYRFLYRRGLALGLPGEHREGLRWLRHHHPARYDGLRDRLAVGLLRLGPLWRVGRRIGAVKLVWRAWLTLAGRHR